MIINKVHDAYMLVRYVYLAIRTCSNVSPPQKSKRNKNIYSEDWVKNWPINTAKDKRNTLET